MINPFKYLRQDKDTPMLIIFLNKKYFKVMQQAVKSIPYDNF